MKYRSLKHIIICIMKYVNDEKTLYMLSCVCVRSRRRFFRCINSQRFIGMYIDRLSMLTLYMRDDTIVNKIYIYMKKYRDHMHSTKFYPSFISDQDYSVLNPLVRLMEIGKYNFCRMYVFRICARNCDNPTYRKMVTHCEQNIMSIMSNMRKCFSVLLVEWKICDECGWVVSLLRYFNGMMNFVSMDLDMIAYRFIEDQIGD
jgi:hypothetical protein